MDTDGIHPQAEALLERQRRFGLRPFHEQGIRRLRLLAWITSWLQNRNPPAVGAVENRTIPGPGGDLALRQYRPSGNGPAGDDVFPTAVVFHGGGYVFGSLDGHDLFCRHLVRESDCVVLSVEYRLAPEHPSPAAIEDAYRATEWAAENPDALDGDGSLAVVGDSAGGALAAIVALMAENRDGPEIDHQLLLYPAVGIEEGQDSIENHAGIVLDEGDLALFRESYFGSDIHLRNPYADPTNACDLSGVPPATILTAEFDPLRDGGAAYAEQLIGDGVDVRYVNYEDMIHGFATQLGGSGLDRAHESIADVAGDLRAALVE